jgi:sugar lactone lactonase YvrE
MKLKFALGLFALAHVPAALAQSYTFAPFFRYTMGNAGAWSIAFDRAGNLYSPAGSRHAIYKISPDGAATIFAGTPGLAGLADDTGSAARFAQPGGVALDATGHLYVADIGNRAIRKISAAGEVTTLTGPNAAFSRPLAVAVDRLGNVYVVDMDAHAIRKITPAGAVSTLAGGPGSFGGVDGEGSAARFFNPLGIAIDHGGNLFVVDYSNKAIRKVTPEGTVTTLATGIWGMSIAVDRGGSVYVQDGNADYNDPVFIRRITQAGTITTLARVASNGGLAFDRAGNLYTVDSDNGTILRGRPDANEAPTLIVQPQSQTVAAGGRAIFAVSATGAPLPDFQWMKDGVALAGATKAALHIEPEGAFARDGGRYTCVVSNSLGRVTSAEARLTVTGSPELPGPGLSNLSLRAQVAAGSPLVAGFVIGPGSGKTVLVRAVGPTLAALGVSGPLADPKLELFDGSGAKIAENDNAGADAAAVAAAVGAFPLAAGGKDAALVATLPPGSYTAQIAGVGETGGVVLVEIYETAAASSRLINLSARAPVGPEGNLLISGFTVAPGAGTRPLLIRAIGVTLASFGVTGALGDPKLELFSGAAKVAENDNWGSPIGPTAADALTLHTAFTQNGAFALSGGSRDAALLVDLLPGGYTLQVRGASGGTGVALLEIYEAAIPAVAAPPATTAIVGVQSFTVIGTGRFIYLPQLRLVEVGGAESAVVTALEFKLEGAGPAGRVPVWGVQKTIRAGGSLEMIDPNFYGDYEFYFDSGTVKADEVSVLITYRDSAGRTGTVSGLTRVRW